MKRRNERAVERIRKKVADVTAKKKNLFLAVYKGKACNISKACAAVSVSRMTYYRWMGDDKEFKSAVEELNESLIDWGEDRLKTRMQAGDTIATIFFLKTKGKARGYIEKQEISGSLNVVVSNAFFPKTKNERH